MGDENQRETGVDAHAVIDTSGHATLQASPLAAEIFVPMHNFDIMTLSSEALGNDADGTFLLIANNLQAYLSSTQHLRSRINWIENVDHDRTDDAPELAAILELRNELAGLIRQSDPHQPLPPGKRRRTRAEIGAALNSARRILDSVLAFYRAGAVPTPPATYESSPPSDDLALSTNRAYEPTRRSEQALFASRHRAIVQAATQRGVNNAVRGSIVALGHRVRGHIDRCLETPDTAVLPALAEPDASFTDHGVRSSTQRLREAQRRRMQSAVLHALDHHASVAPHTLEYVAFACHGTPDTLQLGFTDRDIDRLASAIAACAAPDRALRVSLFACLTGKSYTPDNSDHEGNNSLAEALCYGLIRRGVRRVQIDSHYTDGKAHINPHVRRFFSREMDPESAAPRSEAETIPTSSTSDSGAGHPVESIADPHSAPQGDSNVESPQARSVDHRLVERVTLDRSPPDGTSESFRITLSGAVNIDFAREARGPGVGRGYVHFAFVTTANLLRMIRNYIPAPPPPTSRSASHSR